MKLYGIISENDENEITKEFRNVYTYTPDNRGMMINAVQVVFTKSPEGRINIKGLKADFSNTTIKNLRTGQITPMTIKQDQINKLEKFLLFKLKTGELRSQNPKTENISGYLSMTDFGSVAKAWSWATEKPPREPIPDEPELQTDLPGEASPKYNLPQPAPEKNDLFGLTKEEADLKATEVKQTMKNGGKLKLETKYVEMVRMPGAPVRDPVTHKLKMTEKVQERERKSGIYLEMMPERAVSVLSKYMRPTNYLGVSLDGYLYESISSGKPAFYVGYGDYGIPNQYLFMRNNAKNGVQFAVHRNFNTFDKLFDAIDPHG